MTSAIGHLEKARSPLLEAAQRAWQTTPFYRRLYGAPPASVEAVPFVSHVTYHRARGLSDCLAEGVEMTGALPGFQRGQRRLPVTLVEGGEDWTLRQRRLIAGLAELGIAPEGPRLNVLLVACDATGPFAGELSKGLAWERHQASILYWSGRRSELDRDIAAFAPDVVIPVTPELPPQPLAARGPRVVAIDHVERADSGPPHFDSLLVCDELHVLGARPRGGGAYRFDAAQLHIERDPASGQAAVTTLGSVLFPLIRFCLGRAFDLAAAPGLSGD